MCGVSFYPSSSPFSLLLSLSSASISTILAIILIIIGAVMSGLHDLHFHLLGYHYTLLNVLCTTAYILNMRHASAHVKLSKIEMVYYNNVLSIVVLFPLVLFWTEVATVWVQGHMVLYRSYLWALPLPGVASTLARTSEVCRS